MIGWSSHVMTSTAADLVHLITAWTNKSSVSLAPMTHAQRYRVKPPKATEAPEEHKKYIKDLLIKR